MIPKVAVEIAEAAAPIAREALENPGVVTSVMEKFAKEAYLIAPKVHEAVIRTVTDAGKVVDDGARLVADTGKAVDDSLPNMMIPGISSDAAMRTAPKHFARMIDSDLDAYRAVSTFERPVGGLASRMEVVKATPEQMQKTAMDGTLAYLGMGGNANKYTEFLYRRFGAV